MALSALAPAIERSRKTVVKKSSQVVLRLVPELRPGARAASIGSGFLWINRCHPDRWFIGITSINILLEMMR